MVLHAGGPGDRVAHSRGKWKFTAPKWNRERTSGVREFERRSMARPNAKRGSLNHLTLIVCNVKRFRAEGFLQRRDIYEGVGLTERLSGKMKSAREKDSPHSVSISHMRNQGAKSSHGHTSRSPASIQRARVRSLWLCRGQILAGGRFIFVFSWDSGHFYLPSPRSSGGTGAAGSKAKKWKEKSSPTKRRWRSPGAHVPMPKPRLLGRQAASTRR